MKAFLFSCGLILLTTLCWSQTQGVGTIRVRKSKPVETVVSNPEPADREAEFPGGQEALSAHILKNFHYPARAQEQNVSGTVILHLTIGADGKVAGIKQDVFLGGGCDEEAHRIANLMPAWKPARKNGKNVGSIVDLPFVFKIKEIDSQ